MVSGYEERFWAACPLRLNDAVPLRREKLLADMLDERWGNVRETAA